jgi:hypothetical protein
MKKLLLLSALLIFACSSDDSSNNDNNTNQLFRGINNNTFWSNFEDEFNYGNIISFSTDKLFYEFYQEGTFLDCAFWKEGDWTNVDYDNCIYDTYSIELVSETETTLIVRDMVTAPEPCGNSQLTVIFEKINETTLTVTYINSWSGGQDQWTVLANRINPGFSYGNCVDGSGELLW